jgi:hypothetical protein
MNEAKDKSDNVLKKRVVLKYIINKQNKISKDFMDVKVTTDIKKEAFFISYKDIKNSFYQFIKSKKNIFMSLNEIEDQDEINFDNIQDFDPSYIDYEFIKYLDEDGWISLNKNEFISFDDEENINNIEIMIKAIILKKKYLGIRNKYKRIEEIKSDILNQINWNFKLVVLTANPLIDNEDLGEGKHNIKYLRTINDFNKITSKIQNLFEEEDELNLLNLLPLTEKTFIEMIKNDELRPDILHLICKSVYIVNDNITKGENSLDYVNLIFEQEDNYNMQLMNKKDFKKIFEDEDIKNKAKEITLIISTQLAEDVYNIFKDFGFNNIIVQHTTLADIKMISNFNYNFYHNLLQKEDYILQNIEDSLKSENNENKNKSTFCCCFHNHKKDCTFLKNLKNELYNDTEDNIKINNINELYQIIPHFCHLYTCPFVKVCDENDFSMHITNCSRRIKGEFIKNYIKKCNIGNKVKICCCDYKEHNIKNIIKFHGTNKFKFRKDKIINDKKYFPNYAKMELLVGKNRIVYDVVQFLVSGDNYLNIYCEDYNYEDLKKLGNIIIEYYKEREYIRIKRSNIEKKENGKKNTELNSLLNKNNDQKIFKEIDLINNDKEIFSYENKNNYNIIYFIYVKENNFIDRIKNNNYKKVVFSNIKLFDDNFKNIKLPNKYIVKKKDDYYKLNKDFIPNEYIEFQHYYDAKFVLKKKK